jgi:hypothetical protein
MTSIDAFSDFARKIEDVGTRGTNPKRRLYLGDAAEGTPRAGRISNRRVVQPGKRENALGCLS